MCVVKINKNIKYINIDMKSIIEIAHAKLHVETLHAPGHKQTVEGVGYIATTNFHSFQDGEHPKG